MFEHDIFSFKIINAPIQFEDYSELISYSIDVSVSTISSLTTSNSTLAIHMEGRFGNTLFEIASGIAIAEHYKVSISKL